MKNTNPKPGFNGKQFAIWMAALVIGGVLGSLGITGLNNFFNFIAAVFTRLFQFVAVPTIALTIATTLAELGARKNTGKIFLHAVTYTLLTTLVAAAVGAVLYLLIQPGNLPAELILKGQESVPQNLGRLTVYDHILSVVPNNIISPLASGNVLSILLVAAAVGLTLAMLKESENVRVLTKAILGLQEVLFALIRALVWALPLGIVAFAGQLSAQMSAGVIIGSLGKYVAVVLGGNVIQFFIILPLFLLCRGINPLKVFRNMLPAVLMALGIVREKELGSITNLYVTPVTKLEFLIGKQLPYIVLSMISYFLMVASAVWFFGVSVKGSFLALSLGALIYVTATTGLGLLISSFTSTQISALFGTAILTMLPTTQFSGLKDPIGSLEGGAYWIGQFFPASHFIMLSRGVFTKAITFADATGPLLTLAAFIPALTFLAWIFLPKQEK